MRITMNDGVGLEVEVAGDGPGLLLVHGFGGAKEDFADHVPALARDHTVVDLRPPRPRRERQARPIPPRTRSTGSRPTRSQVADAVGLDRFRLLGHSMGGMVARRVVLARAGAGRGARS